MSENESAAVVTEAFPWMGKQRQKGNRPRRGFCSGHCQPLTAMRKVFALCWGRQHRHRWDLPSHPQHGTGSTISWLVSAGGCCLWPCLGGERWDKVPQHLGGELVFQGQQEWPTLPQVFPKAASQTGGWRGSFAGTLIKKNTCLFWDCTMAWFALRLSVEKGWIILRVLPDLDPYLVTLSGNLAHFIHAVSCKVLEEKVFYGLRCSQIILILFLYLMANFS